MLLCVLTIVSMASAFSPEIDNVLKNVDLQLLQATLSVETKPVVEAKPAETAAHEVARHIKVISNTTQKTKYFPACSSAKCWSGDCTSCATECDLYQDSGCPSTMSGPWVMCEDSTGVYHCKEVNTWADALCQSGELSSSELSTAMPCTGGNSECVSGYRAQKVPDDGNEYTEIVVDRKLSYCFRRHHEWCGELDIWS